MDAITIIRAWAESQALPLQEDASDAERIVLLVLNGEEIPGEMTIAGKINILQVREQPASFSIETCAGNMILDESWADAQSLPSILNSSLRQLQQRLKSPQPQWALAMVGAMK